MPSWSIMPQNHSSAPLTPADPSLAGRQRHLISVAGPASLAAELPIAVEPVDGESVVSWLVRTASRYAITPRCMLEATGVKAQTVSTTAAVRRLVQPGRLRRLGVGTTGAAMLTKPHPTADAFRRHLAVYSRSNASIDFRGAGTSPGV